jgi:S1-C subfamily serine protease
VFSAVVIVLIAVAGTGVGLRYAGILGAPVAGTPISTVPQSTPSGASNTPLNLQAVASKVDPVVVDINTTVQTSTSGATSPAAGTGIIVSSNGEVLTNNHVIQGSTSITVTIQGQSGTHTATVVGADPTEDVALIQIQGVSGLPTAHLADSSTLKVGQSVAAIGNALGQGGTPAATSGAVTALDQAITVTNDMGGTENLSGLIRMDASISPGDSGGPLVNSSGQVVGLITAAETNGRSQNQASTVGYAIPVNTAVGIANQIRSGQATSKVIIGPAGYMGIEVQSLTAAAASRLGLSVTSGALVVSTLAGGPADLAGIGQNAVITAVNGQQITSSADLGPAIQSHKPGQQIQVSWVDQAGSHTAPVTLTSGPAI